MNHYAQLIAQTKQLKQLDSIAQLLSWDQETYMPKGSSNARAEQIETLASLIHREKTSKEYTKLLGALIHLTSGKPKQSDLSQEQLVNLKLLHRDYKKQKALPPAFVKEFALTTSKAHQVWTQARQEDNFSLFLPYLKRLIGLNQQKASLFGYRDHPYDALLDEFEPDMTVAQLDPLFVALGKELSQLVTAIGKQKKIETACLHGKFDADKQMEFGKLALEKVGYNFDFGRLDLSTHPFSMALHPTDSRITSRIHPTSVFDCLSSILHEAGHGLYEMGLPEDHFGTPVGEAISLGIHESQSRFWETFIGQSREFWLLMYPKLALTFPEALKELPLDHFYRAINAVSPSYIRVESDEVTYCLHILVRYEIEKGLIAGTLDPEEIPAAWGDLMKTFVGIKPPTDREGALQDIHWSHGAFGYFPTYALGNLYAAQLHETFLKTHPKWGERAWKEENFHFIANWLRETIHQHGHLYTASELTLKVNGVPLSATPYLNYLKKKYHALYGISS